MNKWIKKSINLSNSQGYLDKLFEIYPIEVGPRRDATEDIKAETKRAFDSKNKIYLIKTLLKFPKFPIDDPYIASLRRHSYLLEKNPETIERVGKRLLSIYLNDLIALATQPKSPSRQLGHSFKNWLRTINYPVLEEKAFKKYKGIAFLEGSDKKLKEFATKELSVRGLKKGIDFILKTKGRFILGEAKFLTDYGGTQNNQFREAIKVARIKKDKVIGVAVLDGIVWFESNAYMHKTVKEIKGIALSALLLKEFIKDCFAS